MVTNWVSVWLVGYWAASSLVAADPGSLPGVTLRLTNNAKVDGATLIEGKKLAGYILREAGVRLTWQECAVDMVDSPSGPCRSPLGGTEFRLFIENTKQAGTTEAMMGFALLNADRESAANAAGIYYPALAYMASIFRVKESDMLGAAIAHELGHMLGVEHSIRGVMCSRFERDHIIQASKGRLLFFEPQARQMAAEIARRQGVSSTRR